MHTGKGVVSSLFLFQSRELYNLAQVQSLIPSHSADTMAERFSMKQSDCEKDVEA